jgi:hypothetical protein
MKRLLPLILFFWVALTVSAQNEPLFIFEQFVNAKIHFKNRSVTVAPMNYDAVNDKMFYKDKGNLMELTNAAIIDSIVWAGKRSFIPHTGGFTEQVKMENGTVFIHWHIKNVNVGSRGALGMVTQAKVESISVRAMGVFSATDATSQSADVYQQKNANEYYLPIEGKLKKITTKKHVLKLYPQHKAAIEEFMDKNKIQMTEPLSVLELLNFCMGLE